MLAGSERLFIKGPVGKIQLTMSYPASMPKGVALVSHPQPLLGGSPRHPVPHNVARRLSRVGWIAVRPSFRGVDETDGEYSDGEGEAEDGLAVAQHMRQQHPGLPLALVGFSFGAHVYARLACLLEKTDPAQKIVLMGLPIGLVPGGRTYPALDIPARTLLLHGQEDAMASLSSLLDWGARDHHPVTVFPHTDHFFKGCLEQVLDRVVRHLG